ncbi:MAG: PQQ-binding-like beta-propeller repeat protein [Candidatus Thermoplasmatota archaeon]|nr:PQQ-binding-like beta-propeller repeat protein [Candidatus Thermoplasmatota archaeon]
MTVRKSIFTVIALIFTSIMITGNLIPLFDQSPNALIGKTTVGPHMQSITLDLANGIRSDNDTNNDDWPMFCRDMSHTSRSDAQPPLYADLLWSYNMKELNPVQGDIDSTPIVIGNTVYACSNNYYMASLNIDNGSKNWHIWLGGEILSTPVYSNGFLYVGAGNKLWKVNSSNGVKESIFTVDTKIYSSPAIYNDTIYFGTMYNNSNLYAVSINGDEIWNVSFGESLRGTPASPAVHNGTVFISSYNGKLYAMDHDGLLDGDQGLPDEGNNTTADILWIKDIGSPIVASPTVIPGAIVVSTYNETGANFIYSFAFNDGSELWNHSAGGEIQSTAAFDPETDHIYVGTYDGYLLAINSTSGIPVWAFDTWESIQSSPAIAGGMVFFGGFDRKIWALDAAGNGDGTTNEVWNYTTEDIIHSSPAISNGRLFIGSDDDKLYCIGAPDFSVDSDINISDTSPYVGENITIKIEVSNIGTVTSEVNLIVTASSMDFGTNQTIGWKRISISELSQSSFSFNWTVKDNGNNIWNIRAELYNSALSETRFQNNNASKLIAYKREAEGEWPMKGGNMEHWGYSPNGTLTNRTLWRKDTGTELLSPVIYKERAIIVTESGYVSSVYINLEGTMSWEMDFSSSIQYPPAAGYDKVFVPFKDRLIALDINGFEDGNSGLTSEVNTDIGDADIIWETETTLSPTAPLTVANGSIFLVRGNILTNFDEDDGTVLFNVSLPGYVEGGAPSISGELVFLGSTDGRIFALDRFNGSLVWTYETNSGLTLSHSLTILPETVFCPIGNRLLALDLDSLTPRWSLPVGSNISTSTAYSPESDSIYFGSEAGKLYMVSPDQGEITMTLNVSSPITTDISVGGKVAYFATGEKRIFAVAQLHGTQEGKICWSYRTDSAVTPSIAVSELVIATTIDGNVYCFGAPNREPISRISLPAFGSIFFANEKISVNASYSSDGDGDILGYTWASDIDGELYRGDDSSTLISFDSAGMHNLTLTVDDGQGGRDTSSLMVRVYRSTILNYNKKNNETNSTVSLVSQVGGENTSMTLDYTVNPSNMTGRDIGIFINITRNDIALLGWMNISISYGIEQFPFGLNQSYLSIYYYDTVTGWMEIPRGVEVKTNRIWMNITELQYSYDLINGTIIAVGTFSNTNPILSSPMVSPDEGPSDGNFNFTVTYTDQDGDFPDGIIVLIDNITKLYMRPSLPIDVNVHDGKEYYYLLQGLPVGNHRIRFEAHDRITGVYTELSEDLVSLDTRPVAIIDRPIDASIFNTGEKVTFDATGSSDPDGELLEYSWTFHRFEDPAAETYADTTDNAIYTWEFTKPGAYSVTLRVSDGFGHISDNTTIMIEIIEAPDLNGTGNEYSFFLYIGVAGLMVILLIFGIILMSRKKEKVTGKSISVDEAQPEVENEKEPDTTKSSKEADEIEENPAELPKGDDGPTGPASKLDEEDMVCINCGEGVASSDSHCPHCTEEMMIEDFEDITEGTDVEPEDELQGELEGEQNDTGSSHDSIREEELLDEDEELLEVDEEDLLDESDE